jgi:hypothetical protein
MKKRLIAAVWFFAIVLMPRADGDLTLGQPWTLIFDDEIGNRMDGVRPAWVPLSELPPYRD